MPAWNVAGAAPEAGWNSPSSPPVTPVQPLLHRAVEGEVRRDGCIRGLEERRLLIGRGLPGAMEVIALHGGEIEVPEDLLALEPGVHGARVGRQERRQLVVPARLLAQGVELPAELLHQLGEVLAVLRPYDVADVTGPVGPFPVEVDAVEHTRRDALPAAAPVEDRQVALDVEVDARLDELLARLRRQRRVGEVRRPRPAAEGDVDPEVRVPLLQLPELAEVAVERPTTRVGDAVDAELGRHPPLIVGPRVALAGSVVDEAA